jgi:hypothetical protein
LVVARRGTNDGAPLLRAKHVGLLRRLAVVAATAAVAAGCGDGRPSRLPVSGQVLIDGQPLSYGYVKLVPTGARASGGYLDEQGRFTLGCYAKDDGVIPGSHKVEVNAGEMISATKRLWHAPKKYSSYNTSGLTQEITEPTDSLVINLTWDGGKPFTERTR